MQPLIYAPPRVRHEGMGTNTHDSGMKRVRRENTFKASLLSVSVKGNMAITNYDVIII